MTTENDCPNKENHTPCPSGYLQWHDWAQKKSRRHKQIRCPDCGLFTIWIRRDKDEPDYGGDEWLIEIASHGDRTI